MSNLGETLRQQRESRKITLDMIAEATKIGKRYLLAIEAGEYGDLPGSVFNKGYVREYAKFVGLDPERMVNAYVEEEQVWQEGVTDPVIELSRKLEQQGLVQRSYAMHVEVGGAHQAAVTPGHMTHRERP